MVEGRKDSVYSFYTGEVEGLVEKLKGFCNSTYGDACEFRRVEVQRSKGGSSWTLHGFDRMNDEAVQAMERHLNTSIDSVKIKFGGSDEDLELRVCRAGNSSVLARFIGVDEVEEAGEDALVVLAVDSGDLERAKDFVDELK